MRILHYASFTHKLDKHKLLQVEHYNMYIMNLNITLNLANILARVMISVLILPAFCFLVIHIFFCMHKRDDC